jgi:hypothetical protein
MKNEELQNRFEYEFKAWKNTIGFEPVELLASYDNAGSYEMSAMHVFKLKRGYAIVHESGCSCYSSEDASIDLYPTKSAVKDALRNAAKETYSYGDLAKNVLEKL